MPYLITYPRHKGTCPHKPYPSLAILQRLCHLVPCLCFAYLGSTMFIWTYVELTMPSEAIQLASGTNLNRLPARGHCNLRALEP